jgi:hypothetical protein
MLLTEYWDALDADFRHHYQLDLEACCFGPDAFGVRRMRAYISQLPGDSALARELGHWDDMREMTATLIELEVNAHRGKDDPPFRYPRPSDDPEPEPEPITVAGMQAFFESMLPDLEGG